MSDNGEETNKPVYKAADRNTDGDNGKKKKMIIGGVVGVIVLVVIIVIIVLATGKGGHPHPHDNPNDPEKYQEDNYMTIGKDSVKMSPYSYTVTLDQTPPAKKQETLLGAGADDKKTYKPVNPELVTVDTANNAWIKSVDLAIELPDQNMYHLMIQDSANKEYTTPEEYFTRPPGDEQTSLKDVFIPVATTDATTPYSFAFNDRSTGEALFDTSLRKFVMQDKFKEFGFKVKSTEVYGLGMSNKQFNL